MTDAPEPDPGSDPTPVQPRPWSGAPQRTVLLALAVVMAVVAVGVLADRGAQAPQPSQGVAAGTTEPVEGAFGLTDAVAELPDATLAGFAGGEDVAVGDLLGGAPLVLNFWATWCAPCVAEMPDLQRLHELAGQDVRLIGVNTQDAEVNAQPFVEDLGITYELLVDRDGAYYTATGSFGMPTTLFVRPDGRVAYRHTGVLTLEQAAQLLDEHLGVAVTP